MTQWLRRSFLEVGVPGQEGLRIDQLRIAFEVAKRDGSPLNTAKVRVWNVNDATARATRVTDTIMQLHAGYEEGAQGLCFLGEVQRSRLEWQRPDRILHLETGDGQKAQGRSIQQTLRGQIKAGDALGKLARAAGLDLEIPSDLGAVPLAAPRGLTLAGPALVQVNRVAKLARLDWTIDDGVIRIMRRGEATRLPALVVNQSTGLIGSPEAMQGGRLKLRMRLNPEVKLRRILRVESREFDGWFLVRALRHYGDDWGGNDYTTEAECTEIRPRA